MPLHHRAPDEYQRPSLSLHLGRYCEPDRSFYAAATSYHQRALKHEVAGRAVAVELVPEPRNPWDRLAVALDIDGTRVGYLQRSSAQIWHDVVRAWNRNGYALFLPGEINTWGNGDGRSVGVTVISIDWSDLDALAHAGGLHEDFLALRDRLTPEQRDGLAEDRGYTPAKGSLRALRAFRGEFSQFTWQRKSHSLTLAERAPFWVGYFVRDELRRQREYAALIARFRRLTKRRIKSLTRMQRQADRTAYLALRPRAAELVRAGRSQRSIAVELGISEYKVRQLTHDVPTQGTRGRSWHANLQENRISDAIRALELQRGGFARAQICAEMQRSMESVKELLSDAKFYEAPQDFPGRLALAERAETARDQGLPREQVLSRLGVSRPAGLRAYRDAAALAALADSQGASLKSSAVRADWSVWGTR